MKYDILIIDKASNTVHGVAAFRVSLEEAAAIITADIATVMVKDYYTMTAEDGAFHKGDKIPTGPNNP